MKSIFSYIKRFMQHLFSIIENEISDCAIVMAMLTAPITGCIGFVLDAFENLRGYAFSLYTVAVLSMLPIIIEIYNKWNQK